MLRLKLDTNLSVVELPYREGKSSADCMRAVHTTSTQRKEHLVKGNSPSHRKTVPPQLANLPFVLRMKNATRTLVFFSGKHLDSRDLHGRSFNGTHNALNHSTGAKATKAGAKVAAGVAASNASRGMLR